MALGLLNLIGLSQPDCVRTCFRVHYIIKIISYAKQFYFRYFFMFIYSKSATKSEAISWQTE